MNFSQKLGFFILIVISMAYVYFSFFHDSSRLQDFKKIDSKKEKYNPFDPSFQKGVSSGDIIKKAHKTVKIYIIDKDAKIRSVNRECNPNLENSCFEYAIRELISAPSKWEKSNGFTSEIPTGTKVLSIRESKDSIMLDLSSNFEAGGGTESVYYRLKQVIKTANANSSIPVYLYINGKQAKVISGEGIMLRQPLNERSLDE